MLALLKCKMSVWESMSSPKSFNLTWSWGIRSSHLNSLPTPTALEIDVGLSSFFKKNFSLILCGFHVMHSHSTHLPVPSHSSVEAEVCHCLPFSPYTFICNCSLKWIISVVWGLWLLLHYQYWILTETPLGSPVGALCCGYPASLSTGLAPSCTPSVYRWGGCWGEPTHSLESGLQR